MRLALSPLALSLSLALAGCGGADNAGTDGGTQTRTQRIAALTGDVAAGQLVYENNGCSGCHGATGTGTSSGKSLTATLKNDPRADVLDTLLNGVPNTAMGSYASLEDQQLADLYAYMKATFGK